MIRNIRFLLFFIVIGSLEVTTYAGTPYSAAVGNPPVCTSLAFRAWTQNLLRFRLAECPIARATTYYFSQSGNDNNSSAQAQNPATPWKTMAKANTVLASTSGNVACLFRRGDTWREWVSVPYSGVTQGSKTVTQCTISNPPTSDIPIQSTVTLTGGSPTTAQVMAYTPSTGVILLNTNCGSSVTAIASASHTYPLIACTTVTVSTLTFGKPIPWFRDKGVASGLNAEGIINVSTASEYATIGDVTTNGSTLSAITLTKQLTATSQTSFNLVVPNYLVISGPNTTIADYGDNTVGHTTGDPLPNFDAFGWNPVDGRAVNMAWYNGAPQYLNINTAPASGDTYGQNSAGTATYYYNLMDGSGHVPGTIVGLRWVGDVSQVFRNVANFAQCDATPGSWFQDMAHSRLYWHPYAGQSIPGNLGNNLEYAVTNGGVSAIYCSDVDNIRIRNIRIDGYGLGTPEDITFNGYAIQSTCSGTNAIVYDGVEAYYSQRHCLGNVHGGSGGIATYNQCKMGWEAEGDYCIVSYSGAGGQEALDNECEIIGGLLPYDQYSPYGNNSNGGGAGLSYAHSGSSKVALFLSLRGRNRPGQWQAFSASSLGDAVPWTDIANCRAFVVDQVFSARDTSAIDAAIPNLYNQGGSANGLGTSAGLLNGAISVPYLTYINCDLVSKLIWNNTSNVVGLTGNDNGGYFINCKILADFTGQPSGGAAPYFHAYLIPAGVSPYYTFYNCDLNFRSIGNANHQVFAGKVSSPEAIFKNCIFSTDNTGAGIGYGLFSLNGDNFNSTLTNNAYANFTNPSDYSNDAYAVKVGNLPVGHPQSGTALSTANNQLVWGKYRLEYDYDWLPRSFTTPAIGPYEPYQVDIKTPRD